MKPNISAYLKARNLRQQNLSFTEIGKLLSVSRQRAYQLVSTSIPTIKISSIPILKIKKNKYPQNLWKIYKPLAEEKIGRKLKKGEIIHHINGIKTDNKKENLYIMSNEAHSLYEANLLKTYKKWIQQDYNIT